MPYPPGPCPSGYFGVNWLDDDDERVSRGKWG